MSSLKLREKDIQQMLSYILKGRREQVITNVGRADITIREDGLEYVIEVKKATEFLHAIGQVIGYASALKNRDENIEQVRIIALFKWHGMPSDRIEQCRSICNDVNVHMWLVDEYFLQFMYDIERNRSEGFRDVKPAMYFLEQFTYKPVMEQRRLEFREKMRKGLVSTDDIEYDSDSESETEYETTQTPPDTVLIRTEMKKLRIA